MTIVEARLYTQEGEPETRSARTDAMLVGVDAFEREYILQQVWYAQRFFYTRRQHRTGAAVA